MSPELESELIYIWNRNSDITDSISFDCRRERLGRVFDRLMGLYKGLSYCPSYNPEDGNDILLLCELTFILRERES